MHSRLLFQLAFILFLATLFGPTPSAVAICDDQNVPTCDMCGPTGCVGPGGFAYSYCRVTGSSYVGNLKNLETVFICSDGASVNCGHSGQQGIIMTNGVKNGVTVSNCNIHHTWSSIQTIQLSGSNNALISNNFIDDGSNLFTIEMNNAPGLVVSGNHFSLLTHLTTTSNNVTFSGNSRPADPILNAAFSFKGSNNVITNNTGAYRFEIKGTAANPVNNNTFSGNDFSQATVLFSNSSGNLITNNTFAAPTNSEAPLELSNSTNNTITNNTFEGDTPFPKLYTSSSTISSNTVVGGGMLIQGSSNTINNNVISNPGSSSLQLLSGSTNNTVNNNAICHLPGYYPGKSIVNMGTNNSGSGNTCTATTNWADAGVANGCTYSCLTPVVLVHGYYGDPVGTWTTTKNFLESKGYRVYSVDLSPGLTPANGNIKVYAKVLAGFIKDVKTAEGVNKVDIVSHSMGGLVSRWYIQGEDYKGDVRNLIMEGTPNHGTQIGYYPFILPLLGYGFLGTAGIQMLPHSWLLNELNTGDPLYYSDFFPDVISPTVKYFTITGTQGLPYPKSISSLFLPGSDDGVVPANSVPLSGVPNFTYALNHNDLHENAAVMNKVFDLLVINSFPAGLPTETAGTFSVLDSVTTTLTSGQTFTDTMQVDQNTPNMVVNLFPNGTVSDFNLVSPTGKVYTATSLDANTTFEQNAATGIKSFSVKTPLKGIWSVKLKAGPTSGTIQPEVWTLTQNVLALKATHASVVSPGLPLTLTAKITNGIPVVTGAVVLATFTSPTSTVSSLPLLDDGTHNDGSANDGVYGGTFTNTASPGTYSIKIDANGTIPTGAFQRVSTTSFEAAPTIDLEIIPNSIVVKPQSPILGVPATIYAQVRNNGTDTATNVTINAFEGNPNTDANFIGEKVITVSPSQTVPVSFTWTPFGVMDYNLTIFASSFNEIEDINPLNDSATKQVKVIDCKKATNPLVAKCAIIK